LMALPARIDPALFKVLDSGPEGVTGKRAAGDCPEPLPAEDPVPVFREQPLEHRHPLAQVADTDEPATHLLAVEAVDRLVGVDEPDGAMRREAQPHLHVAGVGELRPVSAEPSLQRGTDDGRRSDDQVPTVRAAPLDVLVAGDYLG